MGSVVSKDGTVIGYRQMGDGPGVILFHGGANASQSYSKLGADHQMRSPSIFLIGAAAV
jgi:pimeloyl-ACP methyl ester carboxylesterase